MNEREAELVHGLAAIRARLAAAAEAADRRVDEIELLPVTKFFPAGDVVTLSRLGCRACGESRVQEASAKMHDVAAAPGAQPIDWHMVGQVQRNKVASLADWAHTVHSVSTVKVAHALDRAVGAAMREGRRRHPLRVYVQISLDGDTDRGGVDVSIPEAVDELCTRIDTGEALELAGVMGFPPMNSDPDEAFAQLRSEHLRVLQAYPGATGLSAGMSNDLEDAVKHGSTCVRVGTALLGPRPIRSP